MNELGSLYDTGMVYNAPGYSQEDLEGGGFNSEAEGWTWGEAAEDAALFIPRGVEGAVRGVYDFADFVTGDALPDYDDEDRIFGRSNTIAGSLLEGLVTFGVPGGAAFKALGGFSKARGAAGLFSNLARANVAGSVTDFVIGDPFGGRLADLGKAIGWDNGFIDWLATDPDDSELEARLKNTVEGGIVGLAFDGLFEVVRGSARVMKRIRAGESVEVAERAVIDELDQDVIRSATADRWMTEFGYDYDEALMVSRTGELLGVDMDAVRFGNEVGGNLEDIGRATGLLDGQLAEVAGSARAATVNVLPGGEQRYAGSVIVAMRNPDVATGVHELTHVARVQLFSRSGLENNKLGIDAKLMDEVAAEAGAVKVKGEWEFGVDAEEYIATAAEGYFLKGIAPKAGLKSFFDKLKSFFVSAYVGHDLGAIDPTVSPKMRQFFDKLVSEHDSAAAMPSIRTPDVPRRRTPVAALGRALTGAPNPGSVRAIEGHRVAVLEGGRVLTTPGSGGSSGSLGTFDGVVLTDATFPLHSKALSGKWVENTSVRGKITAEDPNRSLDGVKLLLDRQSGSWVSESGYVVAGAQRVTVVGDRAFAQGVTYGSSSNSVATGGAPVWRGAKTQNVLLKKIDPDLDTRHSNPRMNPSLPRGDHFNYDRINADATMNDAHFHVEGLARKLIGEDAFGPATRESLHDVTNRGIVAYQELGEAFGDTALDPETLIRLQQADAQVVKEIAARSIAYKAHLAQMQEYAMEYVTDLLKKADGEIPDADLAEGLRRLEILATGAKHTREVQREIARSLGAQRIRINTSDFPTSRVNIPRTESLDPASAADVVTKVGGRKKLLKRLRQESALYVANPLQPGKLAKRRGLFSMVTEFFINNILSGPITQSVNVTGGVMTTIVEQLELATGHALKLQGRQAARAVGELMSMVGDAKDVLKIGGIAMRDDVERIARGAGHLNEAAGQTTRAISSGGQGVDPQSFHGRALDAIGTVVNLPGRFMMGSDQMLKAMNFRARMRSKLLDLAQERYPGDPKQVAQFVEHHLRFQTDEGQALTHSAVKIKGGKEADAAGFAPNSPEREEFVAKYLSDNFDSDVHHAAIESLEVARDRTFTNDLQKRRGGGGITKVLSSKQPGAEGFSARDTFSQFSGMVAAMTNQIPALKFIMPFIRTPTNIVLWANQRTFGAASDILGGIASREIRAMRGGVFDADLAGRAAFGSAAMLVGWTYATDKTDVGIPVLTGAGPVDPAMRKAWEASGWKPYSVRIGDDWVQYNRLDPVASMFALVADVASEPQVAEYMARDENLSKAFVVSVFHSLMDKTYMKGLADFVGMIEDPSRNSQRYINNLSGGFMPGSSFVHQGYVPVVEGDKLQREVRTTVDAIRARFLFGDRQQLAPRRNALGEVLHRDRGIISGDIDPLSPIRSTRAKNDRVATELVRTGAGIGSPSSKRSGVDWLDFQGEDGISAHDRFLEETGKVKLGGRSLRQALNTLISRRSYQRLSTSGSDELDSPRALAIKRVLGRYRRAAARQVRKDFGELDAAIIERKHLQRSLASGQQ